MKKIKLILIHILFILILSLGTVSASFADLEDSSDISAASVYDDVDLALSEDIQNEEVLNTESNDFSSDLLENGEDAAKSFDDIQTAVDAASENATIELSGTYSGDKPVKLSKSLTFVERRIKQSSTVKME